MGAERKTGDGPSAELKRALVLDVLRMGELRRRAPAVRKGEPCRKEGIPEAPAHTIHQPAASSDVKCAVG